MLNKNFRKIMNENGLDVYTNDFTEHYSHVKNWWLTWNTNGVVEAHPINCFGCVHLSKPKDLRKFMAKVLTGGI